MSYLNWHVGMKVVCVASPERIAAGMRRMPGAIYPAHNGIYTIREIRDDAQWNKGASSIVLLLAEIDNSHFIGTHSADNTYSYVEPGFNVRGFRPVQTRKTDISIFTAMLNPQKQDELA